MSVDSELGAWFPTHTFLYSPLQHLILSLSFPIQHSSLSFLIKKKILFTYVYVWLCGVSVAVWALLWPWRALLRGVDFSLWWPVVLQTAGSGRAGLIVLTHGPNHPEARGVFPDQGSNPCSPHWSPPYHQGSPQHTAL